MAMIATYRAMRLILPNLTYRHVATHHEYVCNHIRNRIRVSLIMSESLPDLTDRERAILNLLPAHISTIADQLGFAESTIRNHITDIRNKDVEVEYDNKARQYFIADDRAPTVERISSTHKSQITKNANEVIEAEHSHLLRRLEQTDPLRPQSPTTDNDEVFMPVIGDIHFGDVVESTDGSHVYDIEAARESVSEFAERSLQIYDIESQTQTYNECALVILGDIATGTHIYDGQIHDIEAYLGDQVTESAQALIDLVLTYANVFEHVSVYCVLGNHGLDRASAARGSNTDLITYRWMQDALRRMRPSNIELEIADGSHSLTTRINSQVVHIRHGQNGQRHVDKTAASARDWRGIWAKTTNPIDDNDTGFDIALRGHFHTPSLDWLMNTYPVITAPSPKPGGEFADKIGYPDVGRPRHLGWCFGVGSSRRLTFKRLIDDGTQ